MTDKVDLKFVSLRSCVPGTVLKGYFGGVYINKFGKEQFTLYTPTPTGLHCDAVPYCADLKKKILPGSGFVELTYQQFAFTGQYHQHVFDVRCTPVPQGNPAAVAFMTKIIAHTKALAPKPGAGAYVDPATQWGAPQQQGMPQAPFGQASPSAGFPIPAAPMQAAPVYTPPPPAPAPTIDPFSALEGL